MHKSRVLAKLREGKPVLCTKTNFNEPGIVELIGLSGYDCIWLCQEHLWANPETLANMILAARATGMDSMVRITKAGYSSAIVPLEMGAKCIMVPHILSKDEAKDWVKATRFAPIGSRGLDGVNADADWGHMSLKEYLKFSNEETALILQIEDVAVIPELDDIASIPGFDILFVGIGDLSQSLGFTGDLYRPEIWEILKKVAEVAKRHGKFVGAPGLSPEWTQRLLDLGYRFITSGADIVFLKRSFLQLREEYEKIGFSFNDLP